MPCDTGITEEVRKEREAALADLEEGIASGRLRLVVNARGQVSVVGWGETAAARSGWCEGCALARIARTGSFRVRSMLKSVGVRRGASFVAASHAGHPHKVR